MSERALSIYEGAYGPDLPDVAAGMSNLATILRDLEEHEAAREQVERGRAITQARTGSRQRLQAEGRADDVT